MSIFQTTLGYEIKRILMKKKFGYMVLVALLMAAYALTLNSGISGTAFRAVSGRVNGTYGAYMVLYYGFIAA